MELDFNIISILDIAGTIQGLVLGILLIVLNKRKHKSTFFLGLFLILYAVQRIPDILTELNVFEYYPQLFLLPFISLWVLYPIFFIYTQQVSILKNQKIKYWLLYPGILFYIFQIYVFFLPYQTKLGLMETKWFSFLYFIGMCLGWLIAFWNLNIISKHTTEVSNQFSTTQSKELKWARIFLIISVVGSMTYIFQYYLIEKNIYTRIFFIFFDLLMIYWVSYHGVVQRNILSILSKKEMSYIDNESVREEKVVSVDIESLEACMKRVDEYMVTSESFIRSELTIVDLADQLKVHPKRISNVINKIHGKNFNNYVNEFRIRKAELLLQNNKLENLSIEGIGNEVGFHSKSAFYSAFKKVTGTTPTRYKSQHAA